MGAARSATRNETHAPILLCVGSLSLWAHYYRCCLNDHIPGRWKRITLTQTQLSNKHVSTLSPLIIPSFSFILFSLSSRRLSMWFLILTYLNHIQKNIHLSCQCPLKSFWFKRVTHGYFMNSIFADDQQNQCKSHTSDIPTYLVMLRKKSLYWFVVETLIGYAEYTVTNAA